MCIALRDVVFGVVTH